MLKEAAGGSLRQKKNWEFPLWLSGLRTQLVSMRILVRPLALLRGIRIWHCHELWYRLQRQLGSGIAVAVVQAGSCSSNSTPSLGTSTYARGAALKGKKLIKIKTAAVAVVLRTALGVPSSPLVATVLTSYPVYSRARFWL